MSNPQGAALTLPDTAARAGALIAELEKAIVGKRAEVERVVMAALADGHVLLDDVPGVAKTLLARSFATVSGLSFSRVQFTPDLLPADITGSSIIDQRTYVTEFRPGPIFAQLVLADEINRAPAKTQAALLEAMQERQVTADGATHMLPLPFLVIATQNPIELEGTYPLPEAQLDRFLLRTTIGYPTPHDEVELVRRRLARGTDEIELRGVITAAELRSMQRALEGVHVEQAMVGYAVALAQAARADRSLLLGVSPRGTLALVKLARARAVLSGRDFVTPDDVKAVALPALAHRVVIHSEHWVRGRRAEDVIAGLLESVPVPVR